MATQNPWAALPNLIIVEILSYLSLNDRLSAASSCKRWRDCLYHPSMWRTMTFKVKYGSRRKTKHLADKCGKFVHEARVDFNSQMFGDMKECLRILQMFTENANIEKLVLQPTSCQIEWPDRPIEASVDLFIDALMDTIKNTRRLKHLSLGCISEFTDQADEIIDLLTLRHSKSIEVLHLSSVKEDPESYGIIDMPIEPIDLFCNLHTLGIDFDYLSRSLLQSFATESRASLEKLVVHVHGVDPSHEMIPNRVWQEVVKYNPQLEVTLNLIHSPEGSECLLSILKPALPLAHLRMFFCRELNAEAITYISRHQFHGLKSVHIVDGMVEFTGLCPSYYMPNQYGLDLEEDPFVMLAWKCPNLQHFSLIGYGVYKEDAVAIARLRGAQLKSFDIALCCFGEMDEDGVWKICDDPELNAEISKSLGYDWTPISDDKLHPAVVDPRADAETAYLSILLADQL